MRKTVFILTVTVCLLLLPGHSSGGIVVGNYGYSDYAPEVRLISPVGETIDITGSEGILFRWSWMEGNRLERQYYDFRIYKGYDMLEGTLIFKTRVPPDTDRIMVRSGVFKDPGAYTWSVRQRYYGLAKSRRSYASFRIVKN